LASSIFERVISGGRRVRERGFGGSAERRLVRVWPGKRLLGRARTPWLRRDAAKRKPRAPDSASVEIERRGGRHHREGEGRALAKLEVARMRREARRIAGKTKRNDKVPRLKGGFSLRRVVRQAVKVFERDLAPAAFAFDLDNGIEGDKRHAEVRRMRRNAVLAPAEHCVQAVLAMQRIAACARFTPVAGAHDVVEVTAARPLHQVAADSRGVAELRRSAGEQRFGNGRIGAGEIRVMSEVGVPYQRTDAHAAIG
jgi:hypothetical protein